MQRPGHPSARSSRVRDVGAGRIRAEWRAPTCIRRSRRAIRWRRSRPCSAISPPTQLRVDRRAGAGVRRRHRARDGRSEPRAPLGHARDGSRGALSASRGGGPGAAGAGTLADVTSCPGAESCRLAVTQSRGLARLLERRSASSGPDLVAAARRPRHQDQRLPERLRPAPHRRRSASRAASGRSAVGAAPHYFVMVGGGAGHDGGTSAGSRRRFRRAARRGGRTPDRLYQRGAHGTTRPRRRFSGASSPAGRRRRRSRISSSWRPRRGAGRLHRPRRGPRVQPGGDGRRMRLMSQVPHEIVVPGIDRPISGPGSTPWGSRWRCI